MCILDGRMSSVVRNTIVTQQPESNGSPKLRSVYDDGEAGSPETVFFFIFRPHPTRSNNNDIIVFLRTHNVH